MIILPRVIYRFNEISIRILTDFFVEIGKLILKFIWKWKESRKAKKILKVRGKVGRLTLFDLRIKYSATIIRQCGTGINTDT